MTSTEETTTFEGFAIVELMGHNVIAGYCSEQVIAGVAMLRVDVPTVNDQPGFTKFFNASAVYGITPTGEYEVTVATEKLRRRPVDSWIVPDRPALPDNGPPDWEPGEGDPYPGDFDDDDEPMF